MKPCFSLTLLRASGPVRIRLNRLQLVLSFVLFLAFLTTPWVLYLNGNGQFEAARHVKLAQQHDLAQRQQVEQLRSEMYQQLQLIAEKVGLLQAQATKINALGERLAESSNLKGDEFSFEDDLPIGGPDAEEPTSIAEITAIIGQVDGMIERYNWRESQLRLLEKLMVSEGADNNVTLSGWPIRHGWLSSHYGMRTDPFTKHLARHKGLDFAGRFGEPIRATAAGVVTWAGKRYGYGLMVEIDHGGGYSTRYGHSQQLLVKVGDVVTKGEELALMGSSGRSTGPHVHYEVLKNGSQIDPTPFVYRSAP